MANARIRDLIQITMQRAPSQDMLVQLHLYYSEAALEVGEGLLSQEKYVELKEIASVLKNTYRRVLTEQTDIVAIAEYYTSENIFANLHERMIFPDPRSEFQVPVRNFFNLSGSDNVKIMENLNSKTPAQISTIIQRANSDMDANIRALDKRMFVYQEIVNHIYNTGREFEFEAIIETFNRLVYQVYKRDRDDSDLIWRASALSAYFHINRKRNDSVNLIRSRCRYHLLTMQCIAHASPELAPSFQAEFEQLVNRQTEADAVHQRLINNYNLYLEAVHAIDNEVDEEDYRMLSEHLQPR